jgi:hypothetical protein
MWFALAWIAARTNSFSYAAPAEDVNTGEYAVKVLNSVGDILCTVTFVPPKIFSNRPTFSPHIL